MKFGRLCIFGFLSLPLFSQATILRSAALNYAPDNQIIVGSLIGYEDTEHKTLYHTAKVSTGYVGAYFEQGLQEHFSWGGNARYGKGTNQLLGTGSALIGQYGSSGKEDFEGAYDPVVFVKANWTQENYRLLASTFLGLKADALLLDADHEPTNFSTGGSFLNLMLAAEASLGPTILGVEMRGDLWKDVQEVVERNSIQYDTFYYRDGGNQYSAMIFAELNNLSYMKPGIRVMDRQTAESKTHIQDKLTLSGSSLSEYVTPRSEQWIGGFYSKFRLPSHFILNLSVDAIKIEDATGYGVTTSVGYKF